MNFDLFLKDIPLKRYKLFPSNMSPVVLLAKILLHHCIHLHWSPLYLIFQVQNNGPHNGPDNGITRNNGIIGNTGRIGNNGNNGNIVIIGLKKDWQIRFGLKKNWKSDLDWNWIETIRYGLRNDWKCDLDWNRIEKSDLDPKWIEQLDLDWKIQYF